LSAKIAREIEALKARLAAELAKQAGPEHLNPYGPWYVAPMPKQGPYSQLNRRFVAEALGPSARLVVEGQPAQRAWYEKD